MRTINKKLIESPTPPLNTKDVYWIDYNIKQLVNY